MMDSITQYFGKSGSLLCADIKDPLYVFSLSLELLLVLTEYNGRMKDKDEVE